MKTLLTISGFIAGFIVAVLLTSELHCGKEDKTEIISKTDTLVRIKVETDTFYKDTGSIKSVPYAVYIPAKVDTPAAITDYYTFKSVQDSLIGKNYRVLINDKLYMNSIFARQIRITTTQTDSLIHTTTTIRKSADGLYLGAGLSVKDITPSVIYLKGRSAYGIGYGIKQKEITLQYHYKIR